MRSRAVMKRGYEGEGMASKMANVGGAYPPQQYSVMYGQGYPGGFQSYQQSFQQPYQQPYRQQYQQPYQQPRPQPYQHQMERECNHR